MKYVIVLCIAFIFYSIVLKVFRNYWKKTLATMEWQKNYFQLYYDIMIKWKEAEQNGKTIAQKLYNEKYTKVAVYGMKEIGWVLCNDLMEAEIEVAYAIDRKAETLACNAFSDIPDVELKLPGDELDEVDLIIVTALQSFYQIKAELQKKYPYKIISLKELIDTL